MEEKLEAEQRAADASRAANDIRSEMERVRKRADELIHTSEQETEALKANAVETTAAKILADIDSKYCPPIAAGTRTGPATSDEEPMQGRVVDTGALSRHKMGTPGAAESLVAEIHGRFDTAYEAVQVARAHAAAVKTEMDRVRGEATAEAQATLHHQSEKSTAFVAELQRSARQEVAAATDRVATGETALRATKEEVEWLRGELRRAQATEATARSAADEDKRGSIRKIAHLEDELREANLEHERFRQQSELELEGLRKNLERNEGAARAVRLVQGGSSYAREDAATPSAAAAEEAAVAAAMEGADENRHLRDKSMLELRGAEEDVTEAKKEVEYLRGELMRTAQTAARSKARQEAAEVKLAELEGVLNGATREHAHFQARAEDLLEMLKASVEEEDQENGEQVRLSRTSSVL